MSNNNVPSEPFRVKYEQMSKREGLNLSDVAERCEWMVKDLKTGGLKPDMSRVSRMLGLNDNPTKTISYKNAVKLCDALHIDYTDVGV